MSQPTAKPSGRNPGKLFGQSVIAGRLTSISGLMVPAILIGIMSTPYVAQGQGWLAEIVEPVADGYLKVMDQAGLEALSSFLYGDIGLPDQEPLLFYCGEPCTQPSDCGIGVCQGGMCQGDELCQSVFGGQVSESADVRCGTRCPAGTPHCVEHPLYGWIYWDIDQCQSILPDAGWCGQLCDPANPLCAPDHQCVPLPGSSVSVCWADACGPSPVGGCNVPCTPASTDSIYPQQGSCLTGFYCEERGGEHICLTTYCAQGFDLPSGMYYCTLCDPTASEYCMGNPMQPCVVGTDGNTYCAPSSAPGYGYTSCPPPQEVTIDTDGPDILPPPDPELFGVTPGSEPSGASSLCTSPDQNGIKWQGPACTCDGVAVNVTVCGNDDKIDQPTGDTCPPPSDCPPPGEPPDEPDTPPDEPCCVFLGGVNLCGPQYCPP